MTEAIINPRSLIATGVSLAALGIVTLVGYDNMGRRTIAAPADPAPKKIEPAVKPTAAPVPAQPISVAPVDWLVFRGNATMTGVGAAKLPDQLDEVWAFKTKDPIEGAPAN